MRILYVDTYLNSVNPTATLLPVLTAAAAEDVSFYGPGYSIDADLDGGILSFMERTGPYDAIVVGSLMPFLAIDEAGYVRAAQYIGRYTAFGSAIGKCVRFYKDVFDNFLRLPVSWRFISLLNYDSYAATSRHTDRLEALDIYPLTLDDQFSRPIEEMPDWVWTEKHFVRKKHMISNAWPDYLKRNSARILSMCHFIAGGEFSYRGLSERKHTISVPGIEYVLRAKGASSLRERGFRPAPKWMHWAYRIASNLQLPVYSNFSSLRLFNATYLGNLIDSRFVYTAADGFGVIVRKFFEIPAAGAVMLCNSPPGFGALGFRSGVNFVEVTPDSLPDVTSELASDLTRAQTIARAGQYLVFERHSLAARAEQFGRCLSAIEANEFAGSRWIDGTFTVDRVSPSRSMAGGRPA